MFPAGGISLWIAKGRRLPETRMKTRAALALLALLMSAVGGQAQVYKDLPGVVPSDATAEYSGKNATTCQLRVEVPSQDSSRWMPRNVYVCEKNGITSTGTRLPTSRERELRGWDW